MSTEADSATAQKNSSHLGVLASNDQQESSTYTGAVHLNLNPSQTRWNAVTGQDLRKSTDSREIVVHKVPFDEGRTLIRREPAVLHGVNSECGKYLTVESEDLDMSFSEESMEELKEAFESVLAINWELYVMGDPENMTQGALELRERLAKTYRLV